MMWNMAEIATFRWTGQRPSANDAHPTGIRPALFAAYRDLARLRYDFPLVLLDRQGGAEWLRSLSDLVDDGLRAIAPQGSEGEGTRRQVLRLEAELRRIVAEAVSMRLSDAWQQATAALLATADEGSREALAATLAAAHVGLPGDGLLLDCGRTAPLAVLEHAWSVVHAAKARRFQARAATLLRRVEDILRADALASGEGRSPAILSRSVGTSFAAAFDYDAMSRILDRRTARHQAMPASRRARLEGIVSVLRTQRFYPLAPAGAGQGAGLPFLFEGCRAALDAYHARLPEMAAVTKALAVGELEVENRYHEERHGALFDGLDERALSRDELAVFPAAIAVLNGERIAAEAAALAEVATSEHSIKVVLLRDDILEGAESAHGRLAAGAEAWGPARMVLGSDDCFVMQASAARLYRMREAILRGLEFEGPALFSLFSGAIAGEGGLSVPPYLAAAAATESRAFPSFVSDPGGEDWASRVCLDDNPQVEADWPLHDLDVEDAELQRRTHHLAFTYADFVACHPRQTGRFVRAPGGESGGRTTPLHEVLDQSSADDGGRLPAVATVDDGDVLSWLVPDRGVVEAARRCRAAWRSLQELAGIHNSHARRLLERERAAWQREKDAELAALRKAAEGAPGPAATTESVVAAAIEPATASEAAPADAGVSSDDPWIETARCTTCNECTNINARLFAYDDNMQAHIADREAGSYRELVEAAERCQVAIIHPGRPRDPDEPGVAELLERAAAFM